jgi:GntR family transcriptional regulator
MEHRAPLPEMDRSSPVPLYHQLSRWLEARIAEGTFPVGDRLPSETQLAARFDLHRNTVRHAISELAEEGLVETRRGVGTFVKRMSSLVPVHRLGRITSFVDDFEINDVAFEDQMLGKEAVAAPIEVAAKLRVDPGASLVKVERLRLADRTPFVFERQYYPYGPFHRLLEMEISGSLYRILTERFGADLHHSTKTLRAISPDEETARRLGIPRAVPCMAIESVTYSSGNEPLEVLHAYYRGDRYLFQVESVGYRGEMRPPEGGG